MAKQVKLGKGKEFVFKAAGGQASRYPWNEWFNGDLLLLERSTVEPTGQLDEKGKPKVRVTHKRDYDVETDAMPGKLKGAARRAYKVIQISRRDADGNKLGESLIIRARDMTADERVAEDLKRAEEKAAREAKDAEGKAAATAPALGTAPPVHTMAG